MEPRGRRLIMKSSVLVKTTFLPSNKNTEGLLTILALFGFYGRTSSG